MLYLCVGNVPYLFYQKQMHHRGFSFQLKPDLRQAQLFAAHAGVCRLVWNLALEQRSNHWRQFRRATGKTLSFYTQSRELTALRAEIGFVKEVSQDALQRTLKALDAAFGRFFKGHGGYPKPRRKSVHDRFGFAGRGIRVERLNAKWGRIFLPKAGWVKFRFTRPIKGKITEAVVTHTAFGWQVSISCKIESKLATVPGTVGIDRGVAVPLMLSNGASFSLPQSVDKLEKRHVSAQRKAAKRVKGSNRWRRALKRAAALKARQARIRRHWAHETTTAVCRQYGTVVIEALRTRNMSASAKGSMAEPGANVAQKAGLNKAILNVGWYQIETMLAYKANKLIKIDPHHTSQTCSACGRVDPLSRESQAVFNCTACAVSLNADHNAAINILRRGNTAVLDVEVRQIVAPCEASTSKLAA